jgi:hypothetical protein
MPCHRRTGVAATGAADTMEPNVAATMNCRTPNLIAATIALLTINGKAAIWNFRAPPVPQTRRFPATRYGPRTIYRLTDGARLLVKERQ